MRVIESQHDKDFAADFEAEFIVPLQVLGGLGEFKAKFADCVGGVHFCSVNRDCAECRDSSCLALLDAPE
jgi:hypothetical protein